MFSMHHMGTRFIIFILSSLFISRTHAQQSISNARDLSLSYSTVAPAQEIIVGENIATMRRAGTAVTLTGHNRYVKELSSCQTSVLHSTKNNLLLYAGIGRMGTSVFAEQFYEAGIAHRLSKNIVAGLKFRYYQWIVRESGYSGSSAILPDINLSYYPNERIAFGVIIRNPVRSRMSANASERLPTTQLAGLSYTLSRKINLALAGKQADKILSLHSGIEYQTRDWVFLRAGLQSSPLCQSFGFGIKHKKLFLDAGIQIGSPAGKSSGISLTFLL